MAEPHLKPDHDRGGSLLRRVRGPQGRPQVYNFERIKALPARGASAASSTKTAPSRIASGLWTALGLSILLFASVQLWVRYQDRRWEGMLHSAGGAPAQEEGRAGKSLANVIRVTGPDAPVRAPDLRLRWEAPSEATRHRIRLNDAAGLLIFEQDGLEDPWWMPPFSLLPALEAGTYSWEVEAYDASGDVLGRSAAARVTIAD